MLLDMLASYRLLFTTRCMKCGKLTQGSKAELPTMRRLEKGLGTGDNCKVWTALHEVCCRP